MDLIILKYILKQALKKFFGIFYSRSRFSHFLAHICVPPEFWSKSPPPFVWDS